MVKINLKDTNFTGDVSCCHKGKNKHIEWYRGDEQVSTTCFITDMQLKTVDSVNAKRKIAWMMEPRGISPWMYDWIKDNNRRFDYVLTYDKELLDRGENFIWYPHGRRWVQATEIPVKTKQCSIIASTKRTAGGHKLRHDVVARYGDVVNAYGYAYKPMENTDEALLDYPFSVTIENTQQPFYWTEKVIDCFASKTIPIYWGNRHITKFFNEDGIIFFDTLDELGGILNNLTPELYEMKKEAIEDNYNRHFQYWIPEDWLWENYNWMFTEV